MNPATKWAEAMKKVRQATPEGFYYGQLKATVDEWGGLHLNKEQNLPQDAALELAEWITKTFGNGG